MVQHVEGWPEGLIKEYKDIFYMKVDHLRTTGKTEHEIPLNVEKGSYVKERGYPQALRQHIREELGELHAQGIIVDSTSPYNSALWALRKKDIPVDDRERYRLVVDYMKLNENTVDEKYPIPRFEDILVRLNGARIFSTLDLKAGSTRSE